MKTINKVKIIGIAIILVAIFGLGSCTRNEGLIFIDDINDSIQTGLEFVYDITSTYYLWEENIPSGINIYHYPTPELLFDAIYYPTLDHWSMVTSNFQEFQKSLDGVRKAAGFKFQLIGSTTSNNIFALVEFVYKDGNAYQAGLKRGDVIITVNGATLTETNYADLFSQDNLVLGIGALNNSTVTDLGKTISVTKVEQSFNPILQNQIVDVGGTKVGYLVYDQFIEDYKDTLINVFKYFNDQHIDELVLDLRYNPGGYVTTCSLLASMIVPAAHLDDVFLTQKWNAFLTTVFQAQSNASSYFNLYFPQPQVNLNLNRVFVLSSKRTASASEEIINGLKPYMTVTLIGEPTYGKYTAGSLLTDDVNPPRHLWGVYLVTSKMANANGVTDYVNGLTPDYVVEDNYITPLGDPTEPLFAKAIEVITGVTAKSALNLSENFRSVGRSYDTQLEKEGVTILDKVTIPVK